MDILKLGKTIGEIKEIIREENFIPNYIEIYAEQEINEMVKDYISNRVQSDFINYITDHIYLVEDIIYYTNFYLFADYNLLLNDEEEISNIENNYENNYVKYLLDIMDHREFVEMLYDHDSLIKADYEEIIIKDLFEDEKEVFLLNSMDEEFIKDGKFFYTLMD